ncbi:MAG: TldD/PmbA family protein [Lachnospiraceae bacterium]|jgi:TldD protein|nr:TldD/PmbA family protein [Lachnospiraceae bacterium]MDE6998697.1 TldD/PmbA family protein [Lachnospiraceae bacterium]
MKVQESLFIQRKKSLLKKLLDMLLEQYPYASILTEDAKSGNYSVSRKNMSVGEGDRGTSRGFVVKVSDGKHYAEYSFNQISEENLDGICDHIRELVESSDKIMPEGLCESEYHVPAGEETAFCDSTDYEIDPEVLGDDAILAHLAAIKEKGLTFSDKILDCQVMGNYQKYTKLFLSGNQSSGNCMMEQNVMWMTGILFFVAAKGEEFKTYFRTYSNLGGAEVLSQIDADIEECAKVVLELLDSESIIPGEYDCICSPDVTGMIVHEAFGHGVEMDMFVKKRAQAEQYVGERVASDLVTMHDGAAAASEVATYYFDDEGTMAHDTTVIEKGILKRGISDLQSALVLGTEPTGNGRRESFRRKAYTRMTNTFFEGGSDTVEEMIASIQYGFLLENSRSGMEDPKNWGIQCMVNIAREIRDGKLTGKIFSPIVLTGYVPDLLKSISMMSENVHLSGSGMCGKGYKEWVKVSDGGPYIKAKIRLG